MPQRIKWKHAPAGYTAETIRAGEEGAVQVRGFYSSEDGLDLIEKLEGIPSDVLSMLGGKVSPSQVDHMLVVLEKDGGATVYLNELQGVAKIRSARSIRKGEAVRADDIVEVERLDVGVEVPADCGILYISSVGWRKALYFDLAYASDELGSRDYDVPVAFGQIHAYLLFQDRCSIGEEEWKELFEKGWFPFIGLPLETVKTMLKAIRSGLDLDYLTDQIAEIVVAGLTSWVESWKKQSVFEEHLTVLETAVERYLADDYLSASGLLYPRIEGLMRTNRSVSGSAKRATQSGLAEAAVPASNSTNISPVLPGKFLAYLKEVYFASFDPGESDHPATRNTVSHGVASPEELSKKAATIGFLIIRQLSLTFGAGESPSAGK